MGVYTQTAEGYGHTTLHACTFFGFTFLNYVSTFLHPASHPAQPAANVAHRTVPLPPSRVIYLPPTLPTSSSSIAVAIYICLMFTVIVISLVRWSCKCTASSKDNYHHTRSPPSLYSTPAGHDEHEELLDDEADWDYEPTEDEDEEADGDGDDYPGNDLNDELDELEKEEVEDARSPSEDPPPPPDPPSQSDAADPDSKPEEVPFWYLLFLGLLSVTVVSLVKWAFLCLHRSLRRIKVYTGSSFLNLFIYVQHPSCRAVVHTTAISSLVGAASSVATFQSDYDMVRRAVELDNASLLEVLQLLPLLKIVTVTVVISVLVDMCWRARVGMNGEVIPPYLFRIFVC
jgi:hypothetical protein